MIFQRKPINIRKKSQMSSLGLPQENSENRLPKLNMLLKGGHWQPRGKRAEQVDVTQINFSEIYGVLNVLNPNNLKTSNNQNYI